MDFRRSGQLDERRRRVLMDEIAAPVEADDSESPLAQATGAKGPVRAYGAAVLEERQPRATDFLPVRVLAVVCWLLVGLTGVVTIETIHVHAATQRLGEGQALLAPLNVSQRGSLAAWYSAALLAVASGFALLTFGIRAHRVDDYRGHYRIWLWAAAALAWLSLDAATGLHDTLGLAIALLAGQQVLSAPLAAGCTLTWIGIYGVLFGALGIRMAIEVWPSLVSFAALLLAGLLYFCGALMQLGILAAPATLIEGVLDSSLAMLAHLSLLAAVGLYARHVYLDAAGRLKVHIDLDRNKKGKAKGRAKLKVVKADKAEPPAAAAAPAPTAASTPAKPSEPVKFGAAAPAAGKPGAAISKASIAAPVAPEDDEDDELDDGDEKLSRAERRRLKKLARRDQRKAA